MIDVVQLRGFAIPFGITAPIIGDQRERVQHGAFKNQLEWELPCQLRFGSHDNGAAVIADTEMATFGLFETEFGLGFWADLMPDITNVLTIAREIQSGGYDLCSVNFVDRSYHMEGDIEVVSEATLDHVAIVQTYCSYGQNTAVWVHDRPRNGHSDRLHLMEERWQQGYRAHLNAKRASLASTVKPAIVAPSRVALCAEAIQAEERLVEMLQQHNHPSISLLRASTLRRIERAK